jgi:hypothetical protein
MDNRQPISSFLADLLLDVMYNVAGQLSTFRHYSKETLLMPYSMRGRPVRFLFHVGYEVGSSDTRP